MSRLKELFPNGWYELLADHLESPAFRKIGFTLRDLSKAGVEITPKFSETFRAFQECPLDKLHTIILSLDPYPGKIDEKTYVADGIAFSSRTSEKCPKSLDYILNAINEQIYDDKSEKILKEFDLTHLANKGILLLNSALSLPIGERSGTHVELWKPFIKFVLSAINKEKNDIAVILMGSVAKSYRSLFTNDSYGVYSCEHPSAANYHGGKWNHDNIFRHIAGYHKYFNNFEIQWEKE